MGVLLVGYDVEWRGEGEVTPRFLEQAASLHRRLGVPATLFIVGETLEQWPAAFRPFATDPLFDLQQHTYSHQLLKTVCIESGDSVRMVRGADIGTIREEVAKTSSLLRSHLGVDCTGLTGPWAYYRGLRDRPDILEVLWDEGLRFIRTDGRNERDWHPLPLSRQPYWYDAAGFPGMLEIPIHGWHDSTIRPDLLGWENLDGYVDAVRPYLEQAAGQNLVYSMVQHDWTSVRADPEMRATEAILRHALDLGLRPMTCHAYHAACVERRARRGAEVVADFPLA